MKQSMIMIVIFLLLLMLAASVYGINGPESNTDGDVDSACRGFAAEEDLDDEELEAYLSSCRENLPLCERAAVEDGVAVDEYQQYIKECIFNSYMDYLEGEEGVLSPSFKVTVVLPIR